jgi:alkanesulfonate monooxygenase SsuD/methylene tetrahydromethanopterin reductase-like flavin-dependent oxidoreductase (luciferase family)
MRFGLALPHYGFSFPDGEVSFARTAEVARRAETLGFDSVWVSDHFFYTFERYGLPADPIASLEPLTALAGLAVLTDRVRLGTLVLGAPFRHPSILAKTATTLDVLSGGRLELGMGAGWLEREFEAFGYAFGSSGDRFSLLEQVLQILTAFDGDAPATVEAGRFRLVGARTVPPSVQRPRFPIWLGSKGGPRSLAMAARYADGWNTVWRWSPEGYTAVSAEADAACERVGRDPATLRRSVGLYSLIAEDDAAFADLFARARDAMPGGAMAEETSASWCADTLSGTPERIVERVRSFAAIGVEELIVSPWVLPFALPEPQQLELFAERVIRPVVGR